MPLSKLIRILDGLKREYTLMASVTGETVVILYGQDPEEDREFYTVTETETGQPALVPA